MAEKKYIIDNPNLMAEWDWEKNNELGLEPSKITSGSNKRVWWICSNNHSWQDTVGNRTNNRNCPYCSGHRVWVGFNDLATTNPALAVEWNYEKNGNLKPENYVVSSLEKVWWKCAKGHEWQATIASRNAGHRCPYCDGQKVIKGCNDLATLNPKLASEWNHEKNGNLKPEDFMLGSSKKVWWKCAKGHEWETTIAHRNNGRGCPYCSGRKKLKD